MNDDGELRASDRSSWMRRKRTADDMDSAVTQSAVQSQPARTHRVREINQFGSGVRAIVRQGQRSLPSGVQAFSASLSAPLHKT